jgi:hypothetical protein
VTFPRHPLRRIGAALAGGLCACSLAAPPVAAAERAVVAFLDPGDASAQPVFTRLAARDDLALGLMSATQGAYSARQALLDVTQGNRTSRGTYEPREDPRFHLVQTPHGWRVARWEQVVGRARTAFADIRPGLLAERLGGAAFVATEPFVEGVIAADRGGRLAHVSLGPPQSVVERVLEALGDHRLVVAVLPDDEALDQLRRAREDDQLLVVMRRPPRSIHPQLLPVAIAGLADEQGLLRSPTTRRAGLIAGIDLLPTLTGGEDAPGVVGREIEVSEGRDVEALRDLERRLRVVYPRRFPALFTTVAAILLAGLTLRLAGRRAQALRVSGLALLWVPFVALVGAALAPPYGGELALMGVGSVALALLTDRFVAWPRGPAAPAVAGVAGYAVDLVFGSGLTIRSLLGPNPRFGSRFYGVGNELEAILPALALVGLAALLLALAPGRRLATLFASAMAALGVVLGAGQLGADVGGVITVAAGGAAAVLVALGRRPSWPALAVAVAMPALALVALAAIDIVTDGDAHFSRVLAGDGESLWEDVRRRYVLAWQALIRGFMPAATAAAIALVVVGWRRRARWFAPVRPYRSWAAALLGGIAGGVVGTLTNDSGPVLLVLSVVVLGAATLYVRGQPATSPGNDAGRPV